LHDMFTLIVRVSLYETKGIARLYIVQLLGVIIRLM